MANIAVHCRAMSSHMMCCTLCNATPHLPQNMRLSGGSASPPKHPHSSSPDCLLLWHQSGQTLRQEGAQEGFHSLSLSLSCLGLSIRILLSTVKPPGRQQLDLM